MSTSNDDTDLPEFDALVASAMARRGDLIATTTEEVLGAGSVEFEGELPADLRSFTPPGTAADLEVRHHTKANGRAAKQARRSNVVPLVFTFVAGAAVSAAAAYLLFATSPKTRETPLADVSSADRSGTSTQVASATKTEGPRTIGAVTTCDGCCAGAECKAAKPELASCPTGRTCVACSDDTAPDAAFRIRMGNFHSTKHVDPRSLDALDVCVRVGGSSWSCEPAYLDATARPVGRVLPVVSRAEDLTNSVELELRLRGSEKVYGSWRSALRLGPNMFCRGIGVVIEDPNGEHLGGLSLFVEDAFYVEIARAPSLVALADRRSQLVFADVVPSAFESKSGGHVLVVGPLAKPIAERLRGLLLSAGEEAGITMGNDYKGVAQKLP